jgi:hypothetical protein
MTEHRDRLEVSESRLMRPDMDADEFHVAITLVSLGPDDIAWFDQHCESGWREHLSGRKIETRFLLTGFEAMIATNPLELIKRTRIELAMKLAHEIVDHMEPIITRYVHGKQVPL